MKRNNCSRRCWKPPPPPKDSTLTPSRSSGSRCHPCRPCSAWRYNPRVWEREHAASPAPFFDGETLDPATKDGPHKKNTNGKEESTESDLGPPPDLELEERRRR